MHKAELLKQVIALLEADLNLAQQAAQVAYEAATHEENVAENKYDTLGLEASYLSTGLARRMEEIRQSISTWRQLVLRPYDDQQGIALGSVITLVDEQGRERHLWLGPTGAAMCVTQQGVNIQVLGREAPLGKALVGKCVGDEVRLQMGANVQLFEVIAVD